MMIWTVVLYSLSIDIAVYPVISAVHALLAAGHLWGIVRMVWWSVSNHELTFTAALGPTKADDFHEPASAQPLSAIRRTWVTISSRRGVLGIESKYFDLRVAVQETIEIVTQSYQCYRTSWLLSRIGFVRLYSIMIVTNCWTVVVVHFYGHRHTSSQSAVRIRVILLLLDVCLDMLTTIVIPCVLFQTYLAQYDSKRRDFPLSFYYDDLTLMGFLNDFQLLLVNGWADLIMRCMFAISLLVSLEVIKGTVLRVVSTTDVVPIHLSNRSMLTFQNELPPIQSRPFPRSHLRAVNIMSNLVHSASTKTTARRLRNVISDVTHLVFLVWGFVVLYAQVQAEVNTPIANCVVAVHPWFREKPGCALVELDGSKWSSLEDTKEAVAEELARFDQAVVCYLILRHHTALHMPANIQNLSNLVGMKLDNVTLIEWADDAALTNTHHPKLLFLFLVRFNASTIPSGMLSTDFPELLLDIEICVSTLPDFPSSLPAVWPEHMWLYVDHANWTNVPAVILDMKLAFLQLAYNQIHEVPKDLFTDTSLTLIMLSGNPISFLPDDLEKPAAALTMLSLDSTNISVLPSWLDISQTRVLMDKTPFCNVSDHAQMLSAGQPLCIASTDCRDLHLRGFGGN
ncbi:TPA: hypothetical protein N0F65_007787 [Lagenidium giganteum]|uniref:Leucine-rich repeat domain, L domain-like n=1 Tax=Lagenidium giganteum TaxID=4803 RepID=A0AAV2Z3X5_9STRA|nr:TPA: hypothetical protein N0F65_007787 [Lagenidium giganteum]